MSFPNPKQTLVLWKLLITGEMPAKSKLRPELKKQEIKELADAGLIVLKQRKELREKGLINLKGAGEHIVLTDKAWDWAVEHYDVEFSKSSSAVDILRVLLVKLGANLKSHNISLAEFLAPQSKPDFDSDRVLVTSTELEKRIREAYAKVANPRELRVRLSKLRQHLSDFPRSEVDKTLHEMQLAGKLLLIGMEDPKEIGSEDEEAALALPGRDKQYFIHIKR